VERIADDGELEVLRFSVESLGGRHDRPDIPCAPVEIRREPHRRFHLLLTPVAAGSGQHLFEEIDGAPQLSLADVRRFASGVLVLIYTPKAGGDGLAN
jgi:hypothetical protein